MLSNCFSGSQNEKTQYLTFKVVGGFDENVKCRHNACNGVYHVIKSSIDIGHGAFLNIVIGKIIFLKKALSG